MKTLKNYQRLVNQGRALFLTGKIDENQLLSLRKQGKDVLEKHPDGGEVVLVLNTGGGSVDSGVSIYSELKALNTTHDVWVVCESCVASVGMLILLAVPAERRISFPMTSFYYHKYTTRRDAEPQALEEEHRYNLVEYEAALERLARESDDLIRLTLRSTNLSKKDLLKLMKCPRHIYNDEAIKLGIISHVLG